MNLPIGLVQDSCLTLQARRLRIEAELRAVGWFRSSAVIRRTWLWKICLKTYECSMFVQIDRLPRISRSTVSLRYSSRAHGLDVTLRVRGAILPSFTETKYN